MTNSPGWAVEITGDRLDIDDYRFALKLPFDPWIEDYPTDDGPKPILRSASWARLQEAADVSRDAHRIIERLNGEAVLVHADAKPLKVGQVIRFGSDGKREPVIFVEPAYIRMTGGRARMRGVAEGPPVESAMQRWFREAEGDEARADLFAHLSRADNWYDLYKSMELAEQLLDLSKNKEWKNRVRRTVNCYRHAPGKHTLPKDPPNFQEARSFVLKVLREQL